MKCKATTESGSKCNNEAEAKSEFCHIHNVSVSGMSDSRISDIESRLDLRDESLNHLTESNKILRERLVSEWKYPKIAIALIVALFGINVLAELIATVNLASEVSKSKEQRSDIDSHLRTLTNQLFDSQEGFEQAIQTETGDLTETIGSLRSYQTDLVELIRHTTDANATLIAAWQFLVVEDDPEQAEKEATIILQQLEEFVASRGGNFQQELDPLFENCLRLKGYCALRSLEIAELRQIGDHLKTQHPESDEANYLLGVAILYDAVDSFRHIDLDRLEQAKELFSQIERIGYLRADQPILHTTTLIGVGQFATARKMLDEFTGRYPEINTNGFNLLDHHVQDRILVATALADLCDVCNQVTSIEAPTAIFRLMESRPPLGNSLDSATVSILMNFLRHLPSSFENEMDEDVVDQLSSYCTALSTALVTSEFRYKRLIESESTSGDWPKE